jgi:hypothetical protein
MCLLTARAKTLARRPMTIGPWNGGLQRNTRRALWGMKLSGMTRTRIAGRRTPRDKATPPWALRPCAELSLPMIAGMAYSTLKCGAATRDGVAFGVSAEDFA